MNDSKDFFLAGLTRRMAFLFLKMERNAGQTGFL